MIEIKGVSKSYVKEKKIIDDMDLEIKNGEIFGFLGPNGAGKTTTIKMITGILNIDEGEILVDNHSIKKEPLEAKKAFGYVPDNPEMFLKLRGIEYLNFMSDIYEIGESERKSQIEKLSNLFEIKDNLYNKIESYSHGMKQKVAIIGALLHNPNNLIIDEPMTGLDPKASYEFKKIMRDYADNNKTVFFSTHILEVAEKICDRIGIINKGELIFVGTIEEMREKFKENKSLEELFMEITSNDK